MTRVAVLGVGAVGARVARQLVSTEGVEQVVLRDERDDRLDTIVRSLGEGAAADRSSFADPVEADTVVLAGPVGNHAELARRFVERGQSVVSTADTIADVRGLLDLDTEARERGIAVVAGAAFAPA